ncbi:MAG: AAA family ATPase [Patescibacteria group bacterium]
MSLKSLELAGFKSFAKKATLSFDAPITGIVGPNGSGKSNVAEAFRFVLGEQSVKSMRGKRTEDLIWNGSDRMPRSNRASVKLTFDNARRLFDVDFDEVAVERVIHRDSSSEYLVNGSPVRLKDIVEMLGSANIGVSGHHIISQGEADRILSVNSRERKGMIEDALGLNVYLYKKEESERKLEKTRENINQVEGLRREVKPHLSFLEKQVEKIERAKDLQTALREAYGEYLAREEAYVKEIHARIDTSEKPLLEKQKTLENNLAEAKEVLSKLERADEKTRGVVEIETELKAARAEYDSALQVVGRIEGELAAVVRTKADEERKMSDEKEKTIPASIVLSHIEEIEGALLRKAVEEIILIIKRLREHVVSAASSLRKESIEMIKKREEELLEQKRTHEKDRDEKGRVIGDLEKRYAHLQKEIEEDRAGGRDAERSLFTFSNELSEVRVALERLRAEKETLKLEEEEYTRDTLEAKVLVGENNDRVHLASNESESRSAQKDRKKSIEKMKVRLEDAGLSGSGDVLKEYEEVRERDAFLEREILDLQKSAETLTELIDDLAETLSREFTEGVRKINDEFTKLFSLMFGGGTASLAIVREAVRRRRLSAGQAGVLEGEEMSIPDDEPEETEEGVEIKVALPRKKIRGLEMLSGGERALTSIALIFAMSQVNPPPFIILDETDAALDEANSKRYGDMIEDLSKRTQLILITHNRETMSRGGVLYGVTMGADAASQLLSVSFVEAVQVAK